MNNLIVVPSYVIGGSERIQYILAKKMISEGKLVLIFFLSNKNKAEVTFWSDPELLERKIDSGFSRELYGVLSLFFFIIRNKFDVVFSSNTHINGFLSVLRKIRVLNASKLIVRESTNIFDRFKSFKLLQYRLYHYAYKFADKIVFQHDDMLYNFVKFYPKLSQKCIVISNPILMPDIIVPEYQGELINILMIGRLDINKNHILAIKAFEKIISLNSNFRLFIFGTGSCYDELNRYIIMNKLSEFILIFNFYNSIEDIFCERKYHIMLHTSFYEGFPNVLLESMYYGVDYIVTTLSTNSLIKLPKVKIVNFDIDQLKEEILNFALDKRSFKNDYHTYVVNNHSIQNIYDAFIE